MNYNSILNLKGSPGDCVGLKFITWSQRRCSSYLKGAGLSLLLGVSDREYRGDQVFLLNDLSHESQFVRVENDFKSDLMGSRINIPS